MGEWPFRKSYKGCIVGVDLNAAVQGPDDACEVFSLSLNCQPDWHTSGIAETPRDSIHDVNPRFFFPTILKRSGPFDASKVRLLVWIQTGVSSQSRYQVSFSNGGPESLFEYPDQDTFGIIGLRNPNAANLWPDMICIINSLYIIN